MQRVYFAGICGTFMGSLALIARECGFLVGGCDANVYPPMSEQLAAQGVAIDAGYDADHLRWNPDLVVIGNALSRGNALVEAILESDVPFVSGPAWLYQQVLRGRHVLAVAGTHGKTTTSSMLAWILRDNGIDAGYLIGGICPDLGTSGLLGAAAPFVVEADEYDTAFFDKRSKFVHYHPRTLIINNLEYDHADIFPDLAAIQRQFHHLIRTVPASGLILHPLGDPAVDEVLAAGCWSRRQSMSLAAHEASWTATLLQQDGARFRVHNAAAGADSEISWGLRGRHNVANALAAVAAAAEAGVSADRSAASLGRFAGVRRRLELIAEIDGRRLFDDFAHHPTAIAATLKTARSALADGGRLIAVIEPRSNSMRLGVHREALPAAVQDADRVLWYQPVDADWGMEKVAAAAATAATVYRDIDTIIADLVASSRPGDDIVIVSNGGFGGIHQRLRAALQAA